MCRWTGCNLNRPIRRDNLLRHVREHHLRNSRRSRISAHKMVHTGQK
jgi:hypothetical protein